MHWPVRRRRKRLALPCHCLPRELKVPHGEEEGRVLVGGGVNLTALRAKEPTINEAQNLGSNDPPPRRRLPRSIIQMRLAPPDLAGLGGERAIIHLSPPSSREELTPLRFRLFSMEPVTKVKVCADRIQDCSVDHICMR